MKIELKHLVPYVPYNLDTEYKLSDVICLRAGIRDEIREKRLTAENLDFVLQFCKPKLRPLSELNSKIQIAEYFCTFKEHLNRIFPTETMGLNTATWSYRSIEWCLQYHFDVFDLISKGLAVSLYHCS